MRNLAIFMETIWKIGYMSQCGRVRPSPVWKVTVWLSEERVHIPSHQAVTALPTKHRTILL